MKREMSGSIDRSESALQAGARTAMVGSEGEAIQPATSRLEC